MFSILKLPKEVSISSCLSPCLVTCWLQLSKHPGYCSNTHHSSPHPHSHSAWFCLPSSFLLPPSQDPSIPLFSWYVFVQWGFCSLLWPHWCPLLPAVRSKVTTHRWSVSCAGLSPTKFWWLKTLLFRGRCHSHLCLHVALRHTEESLSLLWLQLLEVSVDSRCFPLVNSSNTGYGNLSLGFWKRPPVFQEPLLFKHFYWDAIDR